MDPPFGCSTGKPSDQSEQRCSLDLTAMKGFLVGLLCKLKISIGILKDRAYSKFLLNYLKARADSVSKGEIRVEYEVNG